MSDWYRNKEWSNRIENDFFAKLARAQTQKFQYVVIQAGILAKKYPEVAIRLIEFYFQSRINKFFDANALTSKATAYISLGEIDKALEAYRETLEREEEFPNLQSGAYMEYPYFVATRGIESEYDYALHVLNKNSDRPAFPLDMFIWYASKAIIENSSKYANKALEAAQIKKSGLLYHQNLGLVGKEHKSTIKLLRKIIS